MIDAPEITYDQELIDVLGVLQSVGFVSVRNERGEINGIVTAADLAHAYGDMATPFFLIGELDQLLRHIVSKHIELADVIPSTAVDMLRNFLRMIRLNVPGC